MTYFVGIFSSCQDAKRAGYNADGTYEMHLPSSEVLNVWCDMSTVDDGWIVFQRRSHASSEFNRRWNDYKNGFGSVTSNFWLGNEKLHKLAAPGMKAILRVDLKYTFSQSKFAIYTVFEVFNETNGYRLRVDGYSGTAVDMLSAENNAMFSTRDKDQDRDRSIHCAENHKGGWWYNQCRHSNLNGHKMYWTFKTYHYLDSNYLLLSSEMKIRYPHP